LNFEVTFSLLTFLTVAFPVEDRDADFFLGAPPDEGLSTFLFAALFLADRGRGGTLKPL